MPVGLKVSHLLRISGNPFCKLFIQGNIDHDECTAVEPREQAGGESAIRIHWPNCGQDAI